MSEIPPVELPVILKMYDLVKWCCERIAGFPRAYRCTLGDRIEFRLYDVFDGLVQAKYSRDRLQILRAINLDLERLRFQFRLAHDLRCLSAEGYGFACRNVNEIGQMIGGWIRASAQKA